jgi:glycosyltransferase involved in cell wall biosynthesis
MSEAGGSPRTVVHLLGGATEHFRAHISIVSALHRHLDPERYRLIALFLDGDGPFIETLEEQGMSAKFLPFRGGRDLGGSVRFARELRRDRPSLIHAHVGGRSRTWISRLSGSKLLVHFHATHEEDCSAIPLRRLARGADAVLATSRAVADLTGRESTVIYPGVEIAPRAEPAPSSGPPRIGTVARLEPIKQLDQLLEAVALLRDRHPDLEVEIAGDGSAEQDLKHKARALGIDSRVSFLGWRLNVRSLHGRWRAFAIPSRHEGFGVAALEAMSSGLPVVGSATGGLQELIADGKTGYLVPSGDTKSLADRLDLLLSDDSLQRRMSIASLDRAKQFSLTRMCEEIERLYDRESPSSPG